MELPSWLLRSRVLPPRRTQRLIARPRILQTLSSVEPGQIVWACAPPGFGKTVALAQWSECCHSRGVRTAWLQLALADQPATVMSYLAFSCHVAGLDLSHMDLLTGSDHGSTLSLKMQTLLSCIERTGARWLLIIDDAEQASAPVVHEVLEPLARFLPANLILAFASRDATLLDLTDLDQRGVVVAIKPATLRLTRDEIRQLWGRSVSESQLRAVELRSEGWPALLQLLLQQGSTPHFDSTATSASGAAAVTGFFETRLLARMDSSIRGALLRLSLIERFTLPFAARLLGLRHMEEVLGRLAALGIVARSPGVEGTEFAIHALLRNYLAARFTAEQPRSARGIHKKAAHQYLASRQHVQAARHAAASGDPAFLGDIVEASDPLLLGIREGFPRLRQIVRVVPDALARQRPRIGYACVASALKAGRLKEAKALFCDLEGCVGDALAHEVNSSALLFERALCHSLLAVYKGTPITEGDIEAIERFVAATPSLAPMVLSLAETLRSFVQAQASHFEAAKASARRAIAQARAGNSAYAAFFMYCDLGMITGVQGKPDEALRLFEEGDAACRSTVRLDERLAAIRDAFRLELQHELNPADVARSGRLKNLCVRLPNLEGWLDVYASAFRTYSEQLFLGGNLQGALAILSAGIDHLREQEIERIPEVLAAQRVLLLALARRVDAAVEEFRVVPGSQLPSTLLVEYPWRSSEVLIEAAASIDLATGARDTLNMLAEAITHAARTGNVRSEIRFRRWWEALMRGDDAARSAEPRNAERLALLEAQCGFSRSSALCGKQPRRQLSTTASGSSGAQRAISPPPSDYLSARELEIIERLGRGMSDKRIGMDLGISAHGVRYHLKRIYAKLHARDRREAREKASRLGLL